MDLNVIKQRLDSLNKQSTNSGGGNKNLFWKPSVGKQLIRVVPSKFNKANPFTEMMFYYGIGSKRVMASPKNWGEKDPIMEFAKQLRGTNDKENWRLAKKLDAKNRIFIPVIVRGEEDKGVRLWQFGKLIYEDLLSMAMDDEIGDYTDIVNGRDFTLETVGPESTGTNYNKTSVRPRMKTSPLSEDSSQVETWLETQPNPKEVFKRFTFDEMKDALVKWLSPEDNNDGDSFPTTTTTDTTDRKDLPWEENGGNRGNFSLDTSKVKENKKDQFDSIFD